MLVILLRSLPEDASTFIGANHTARADLVLLKANKSLENSKLPIAAQACSLSLGSEVAQATYPHARTHHTLIERRRRRWHCLLRNISWLLSYTRSRTTACMNVFLSGTCSTCPKLSGTPCDCLFSQNRLRSLSLAIAGLTQNQQAYSRTPTQACPVKPVTFACRHASSITFSGVWSLALLLLSSCAFSAK